MAEDKFLSHLGVIIEVTNDVGICCVRAHSFDFDHRQRSQCLEPVKILFHSSSCHCSRYCVECFHFTVMTFCLKYKKNNYIE